MKIFKYIPKIIFVLVVLAVSSCNESLTEINENPNGVDPNTANPNLLLPTVMTGVGTQYLRLGYGRIAGVVQHTQEDAWKDGFNDYNWSEEDDEWKAWYGFLRNNDLLYKRSAELGFTFHQGVALTMKAFIFGTIADLWGDAPYTNALKGDVGEMLPVFDSQEVIYKGIIEDLKQASALFANADVSTYAPGYDVYYNGDKLKWQKFANSLLLRYYMRVSAKLPDVAKAGIEQVYTSGIYLKEASDDAMMDYIGTASGDSWPTAIAFDVSQSNWRRRRPAATLVNTMAASNDPRLKVWFQPVHVRWVSDATLKTGMDEFIRKDGVIQNGVKSLTEQELRTEIAAGRKFTRHFNPTLYKPTRADLFAGPLNTSEYVGIPAGMIDPTYYNENPTTGQQVQNQHASQLSYEYQASKGGLLKARLASAAETAFILAEAAQKGWAAGGAEAHYNNGIKQSLQAWGVADQYDTYVKAVAYKGTLAQIIEQKWIAGWTASTEAWFDYRRTALPALVPGLAPASRALPLRFIYSNNELNNNGDNTRSAIDKLEETNFSGPRKKNSQWSKPWLVQGTGKPW
ncbi:Starch-binding associating with outer membrane [Dyadobacter sp. SG02]|uniref:SusD/RagB family nutrient-binding outer membrane lipoprotein n=1 Tax=Dyadobacter sp. SG02 TaxID=1855291 RepID=UPI0008CAE62F|nr:SusD/RagB family nutrient-binding outer membrane lipoprotein [Dyadobacter sp. SG02]SEJ58080.1 Starch-binding associating with outer membrane [Dyadobacter sp. SG02]